MSFLVQEAYESYGGDSGDWVNTADTESSIL